MSLIEFQRAFADLIESPERCLSAREDPSTAFATYELTDREKRRLAAMVRSEAMSINCTLYRVNRLTPVYSVLPLTCRMLGDRLQSALEAFWTSPGYATSQYRREAFRFGEWLLQQIADGTMPRGPIEDAIRFELAAFEIRTAPRRPPGGEDDPDPRKKVLRFTYDPDAVLNVAEPIGPSLEPLPCEEWVLLDATGDSLQVYRLQGRPTAVGVRATS